MNKKFLALAFTGAVALTACGSSGASEESGASDGGCNEPPPLEESDSYTIGFAGQQSDHPWTIAFNNSMQEVAEERGHQFVSTDAQASTAQQVENVESLIAQQVDAIVITPREEKPLAEVTVEACEAGIPVFVVDRSVDETIAQAGEEYVAYIGSDFVQQGRMVGEWLVEALGGSGTVIELAGTTGSAPAMDRAEGFREAIEGTDIEIVASQDADFVRDQGRQAMETLIQQHPDVDAVFAHNDEMALGAITALEAAGKNPGQDPLVVSIDGQREALEAIIAGKLNATAESNPRFGPITVDTIEAYGQGEEVEPVVINEDKFFDADNAEAELENAF